MFLINKFIRKLINIQGNRKLKFSRKSLEIVDVLVLDMRSKLILFSKVAHIGKTCSKQLEPQKGPPNAKSLLLKSCRAQLGQAYYVLPLDSIPLVKEVIYNITFESAPTKTLKNDTACLNKILCPSKKSHHNNNSTGQTQKNKSNIDQNTMRKKICAFHLSVVKP